ncbi:MULTISPECIES: hypothetical protein [unclassified Endozoicomonas]|uniref:hypothetical protein n=1 Tax=unclassified Endozoicomonas TaxID=2644528 RepID=UPI003BAE69F3
MAALAIGRLKDTLALIASMNNHTGYIFPVLIVPMGEDKGRIQDAVDSCYESHSGLKITVSRPINYDPENFEKALT